MHSLDFAHHHLRWRRLSTYEIKMKNISIHFGRLFVGKWAPVASANTLKFCARSVQFIFAFPYVLSCLVSLVRGCRNLVTLFGNGALWFTLFVLGGNYTSIFVLLGNAESLAR